MDFLAFLLWTEVDFIPAANVVLRVFLTSFKRFSPLIIMTDSVKSNVDTFLKLAGRGLQKYFSGKKVKGCGCGNVAI